MRFITKSKFFSYYLPLMLSAVLLATAAFFWLTLRAPAALASAGPNGPGTMATSNASGGTKDWTTPDNAKVEDGTLTSAVTGSAGVLCLAGDTLITSENGKKFIRDLKFGDLVLSYNPATGKTEPKEVSNITSVPISESGSKYYHIYFDGGDVRATYDHPFYVNGEYVMAENLKAGNELFNVNGEKQTIIKIDIEENTVDYVWNISVNDNHNFFANGVLVHNAGSTFDHRVRIIKGGAVGATDRADASAWPATLAYTTYGSASDAWGETWTAADINSGNFGVAISAFGSGYNTNSTTYYLQATNFGFSIPVGSTINGITVEIKKKVVGGSNATANIDYIRITVAYTAATGKTGNFVQQGGKFRQSGGKMIIR